VLQGKTGKLADGGGGDPGRTNLDVFRGHTPPHGQKGVRGRPGTEKKKNTTRFCGLGGSMGVNSVDERTTKKEPGCERGWATDRPQRVVYQGAMLAYKEDA